MTGGSVIVYIVVNVAAWLVIQLGFAWVGTRMPVRFFEKEMGWSRILGFERSGKLYERLLLIKAWKDLSPDGASWFDGGFPKQRLASRDPDYLAHFMAETRRGEAVHWAVILAVPFFYIWNPPDIAWVNIVYALAANLPFIAIQRYNRNRMMRVLKISRRRSDANDV